MGNNIMRPQIQPSKATRGREMTAFLYKLHCEGLILGTKVCLLFGCLVHNFKPNKVQSKWNIMKIMGLTTQLLMDCGIHIWELR